MKERGALDLPLVSVVLMLLGLGLVMVYSSSAVYAMEKYGSSTYFFWRQLTWAGVGAAAGVTFIFYDHRKLRRWVKPSLIACAVVLALVLVFGKQVSGARRWLKLGWFGFQPSEFAKLILIVFTAYYCDKKRSRIHSFRQGLLPLLSVLAFFSGMIFFQPDLGTPVLILLTCLTLMLIAGARFRHIFGIGAALLPLLFLAMRLEPYRWRRILAFLDPWENARGASYQLVQSLLALGSGGLFGSGLGDSHSKLLYLPEPHTDFIFPIFGEEFGLMGSWFILVLFGVLAGIGFKIAARASSLFGTLLAGGITLMTLYQAVINIAMVTGCLPTKGVPLPFLSFGGSSLVVTLAGMGILINISRSSRGSGEPEHSAAGKGSR